MASIKNDDLERMKKYEISYQLISWYKKHKRNLPWRETNDPYIIWISEIILQQTRVAQGLSYFLRFIERFPTVSVLANAKEDEVLKYWQGLGYYSRARNLHKAASTICNHFGGVFPSDYKELLSLSGVGEYTAAAIASFSGNQPYPVVDGNVFRVLSRLFMIDIPINTTQGKNKFREIAMMVMDSEEPGCHNQAIMEFGALQCVPQNPDCLSCVLMEKCLAFQKGEIRAFPVKQKSGKSRDRYFHYFHIIYKGYTWISRREEKDIWQGLYEFPLIETSEAMTLEEIRKTEAFRSLFEGVGQMNLSICCPKEKHILSHQVIHAVFYRVEIEKENEQLKSFLKIQSEDMDHYAVSRLIHLYLLNA